MSKDVAGDLSFYCKAYYVRDLRRFVEYDDDLVLDRDGASLQDDDVVFIHPDYSVTRSVFMHAAAWQATPRWVHYCTSELSFRVPEEPEGENNSAQARPNL